MKKNRRDFMKTLGQYAVTGSGLLVMPSLITACSGKKEAAAADTVATAAPVVAAPMFFKISLAQWSLHKMLFDKQLDNLDFALKAKNDFGIEAVEYVNQFFKDKAKDMTYLGEMKKRTDDNGITNVLIMIDGEGGLGDTDAKARKTAVENHYKWVEAAKFLGCHSIRVNAYGEGTSEEVQKAAIDGLGKLTEFATPLGIGVIVENHGGYSSDGQWLSTVIGTVNKNLNGTNCGTLPDFGNFCMKYKEGGCEESYDRYKGVTELMPFAKGVSAKSHEFDAEGNDTEIDYVKMLQIVKDAGYTGHIGIEYEGSGVSEEEGVRKTKALLEKASGQMV
jgi:sugar phosphate isomerase/epimerase